MMVKLENNKKYIIFIIILFIFITITISIIFVTNLKEENQVLINEKETENYPKKSNNLAIMIETEEDSNKYQEAETFPSNTKYYLNETLSKCTNGNKISYNSQTNEVTVKGINADKCYLYFDVIPVFFEVIQSSDTIIFARTEAGDFDNILTTETPFELVVKNNNGTMFNKEDLEYQIEVINSNKFSLKDGSVVTKTINGGEKIDETVSFNLKIDDLTRTDDKVTIKVTGNGKSYTFDYNIIQEGAIQYIEDLVDMALAIRERSNPNNLTRADIQNQRFKLTRDLDLNDNNSYKDYNRTDYGDVNGNNTTADNLKGELTSDTGFLPIGELDHPFQGVFNGGEHTITNVHIHKSLQTNIGFFGTIKNATIKNLTLANANVTNDNQTGGIVAGKMQGGLVENITVSGTVTSTDKGHQDQDTYTGGIIGVAQENASINNCTNNATVTTQFTGDTAQFSGPAGGIVGSMTNSTISNCTNNGTVTGQKFIGGIAGFAAINGTGTVKGCHNYGTVTTYITTDNKGPGYNIGGICGYNGGTGIVDSCVNHQEAIVKGLSGIGGIVGRNLGTIKNSDNYSANITGTIANAKVGHIYGDNTNGTYSNNHDYAS